MLLPPGYLSGMYSNSILTGKLRSSLPFLNSLQGHPRFKLAAITFLITIHAGPLMKLSTSLAHCPNFGVHYTLHFAAHPYLPFRLLPSCHYASERLTRPYSRELPAAAVLSQLANIARLPRHTSSLHEGRFRNRIDVVECRISLGFVLGFID